MKWEREPDLVGYESDVPASDTKGCSAEFIQTGGIVPEVGDGRDCPCGKCTDQSGES